MNRLSAVSTVSTVLTAVWDPEAVPREWRDCTLMPEADLPKRAGTVGRKAPGGREAWAWALERKKGEGSGLPLRMEPERLYGV
jgi:hypothetical protein